MDDLEYLLEYLYEEEKIEEGLKTIQESSKLPCGCVEVSYYCQSLIKGPCCHDECADYIAYTCISCSNKG